MDARATHPNVNQQHKNPSLTLINPKPIPNHNLDSKTFSKPKKHLKVVRIGQQLLSTQLL